MSSIAYRSKVQKRFDGEECSWLRQSSLNKPTEFPYAKIIRLIFNIRLVRNYQMDSHGMHWYEILINQVNLLSFIVDWLSMIFLSLELLHSLLFHQQMNELNKTVLKTCFHQHLRFVSLQSGYLIITVYIHCVQSLSRIWANMNSFATDD